VPTYAYACTACGHAFEIHQSFSDDALTVCPECEGRLRKVFSSVGVVFKGSGFYRNDARAGSTGKRSSAASSTTAASGAGSSGASGGDSGSGSGSSAAAAAPAAASSSGSGASSAAAAKPAASA
jgi:putative FmdB family regulatory protein